MDVGGNQLPLLLGVEFHEGCELRKERVADSKQQAVQSDVVQHQSGRDGQEAAEHQQWWNRTVLDRHFETKENMEKFETGIVIQDRRMAYLAGLPKVLAVC